MAASDGIDLPRQLGPYKLLRRLGQGGMAEVFLATVYGASGFEKRVAIKTLLPELQGDGRFEKLLIEEARLGARLGHGNLIQVHDLGVAGGIYYVRMDWVDGADLTRLLSRAPLPVELALLVSEQVSAALEYVHSLTDDVARPLGLVHCDVSPSNVLVSRAGEVKLADLGIARATMLAQTRLTTIRRGKYPYMAPEQVAGQELAAQSDQFGFGVMLCELLTGSRPFDADTPEATMERIRVCEAPVLDGLEQDLVEIARRCLQRDAGDRYASATELREQIAHARGRRPAVSAVDLASWVRSGLRLAPSGSTLPAPATRPLTRTE